MLDKIDDRTQAYFDGLKKEMEHVGSNGGWDGIKDILKKNHPGIAVELIDTYDGYVNSSNIEVFRYTLDGKERFCAELSYQTAIDDYCIETHIFTKKPTRQDVLDLRMIHDIGFDIKFRGLKTEFTCWECGCWTHWLDSEGSLAERYHRLRDKYCGC